jgi:hypothetical protein
MKILICILIIGIVLLEQYNIYRAAKQRKQIIELLEKMLSK